MRRLLSFTLALVMCWSLVYVLIPAREASAVETGNATLTGERYTVDWTIPDIGTDSMLMGGNPGAVSKVEDLSYEILGFVSPKYPDSHATDKVYDSEGNVVSGGYELLDGTFASNHFLNDPWVGIYGNEDNALLVDLGTYYTNLSGVTLNMLSDPELGIFLPSKITIASSVDGVTYNEVGQVSTMVREDLDGETKVNDYYVPTEYASITYDVEFASTSLFKGQYLLIVFEHEDGSDGFVRNWTFISELTVETSGAAVLDDFSNVSEIELYNKPTKAPYDVNVALNSTYQIIGTIDSGAFADTGRIELTDGKLSDSSFATSDEYVGITPTEGVSGLQIDLGSVTSNISSISLSGYGDGSSGYYVPSDVKLYASEDGKTYYSVSLAAANLTQNGSLYNVTYNVSGAKGNAFTARYLTFVVESEGELAIDELYVYTTNASEDVVNIAPDSDYKYLLNTPYYSFNDNYWTGDFTSDVPTLNTYAKGDLNNNISATGTFLDPAWVGYNYTPVSGDYVEILFNLGSQKPGINKVNFKLLDYTNSSTTSAASVPDTFTVFYSNDENSFSTSTSSTGAVVDTLVVNSSASRKQVYHTYAANLNNVTAQYIKVRIPKAKRELHIDEVQIWTGNVEPTPADDGEYETINYDIISGVWFDCFTISDLYLYQGTYQLDEQSYRERLANYLSGMKTSGINTIMIHTRSHGDAIYGSYDKDFTPDNDGTTSISPYSKRYTGSNYAISTYDAFEIFLDEAHKLNLSVHAWVNPLRIGYAEDLNAYSDDYEVKQIYNGTFKDEIHSDYIGIDSDKLYWLNIGYENIRFHIIDTVMEIVNNYDIDGIIMDDYFYPAGATTAFDQECYSAYKGAQEAAGETVSSLGDWRRNNTNNLVRGLYKRIKTAKDDVVVGISPMGDVSDYYNSYNYDTMYADVKLWCENTWSDGTNTYNYMDYISPQLYWAPDSQFAYESRNYWKYGVGRVYEMQGRLIDWCQFDYVDGVRLVVSLGLYRNFESTVSEEYKTRNVILEQLRLMRRYLLATSERVYTPVDTDGVGLNLVYGQIMYRSDDMYTDYTDPEGWNINSVYTADRAAAVRNELVEYWQDVSVSN